MPTKIISYDNLALFKEEYDKLLDSRIVALTQAEYDALAVKEPHTLYLILDEEDGND